MKARVRALIAYGIECGFSLDEGLNSRSHYTMSHPNGAHVELATSPGDIRGDENARAKMRRLSGVTPARPHSGKHKKGVNLGTFRRTTELVESRSLRAQRLQNEHRDLCDRIRYLQSESDMDGARHVVVRLLQIEDALIELGFPPPPRGFRSY